MGIRNAVEDKARQFMDATDAQAKAEFIQKVMKWEEVVWMDAMFGQFSRKKREQARDNFRKPLEDDELELFNDYVNKNDVSKEYKTAYKEEKKRKGVKE